MFLPQNTTHKGDLSMDTLDFDNMDFTDPNATKGLLKVMRQSMHAEITTAILSAIAVVEFQKGKLTKGEKNKIIRSIENNLEELMSDHLVFMYGDGIKKHF
jgi:hypothetical protein